MFPPRLRGAGWFGIRLTRGIRFQALAKPAGFTTGFAARLFGRGLRAAGGNRCGRWRGDRLRSRGSGRFRGRVGSRSNPQGVKQCVPSRSFGGRFSSRGCCWWQVESWNGRFAFDSGDFAERVSRRGGARRLSGTAWLSNRLGGRSDRWRGLRYLRWFNRSGRRCSRLFFDRLRFSGRIGGARNAELAGERFPMVRHDSLASTCPKRTDQIGW